LPEMPRESIYLNGYDRSPSLDSICSRSWQHFSVPEFIYDSAHNTTV